MDHVVEKGIENPFTELSMQIKWKQTYVLLFCYFFWFFMKEDPMGWCGAYEQKHISLHVLDLFFEIFYCCGCGCG